VRLRRYILPEGLKSRFTPFTLAGFRPLSIGVWIVLGLSVGLAGCEDPPPETTWQTIPIKGLYSLELPSTFVLGYDMHEYANLQYYDLSRNIFIVGIEDSKDNLGDIKRLRLKLDGYFEFVEDIVLDRADTSFMEASLSYDPVSFPNQRARMGDYFASSEDWGGQSLFYRIAVYENAHYFVQVVLWMPYNNHCDHYELTSRILQSFTFLAEEGGTAPVLRKTRTDPE